MELCTDALPSCSAQPVQTGWCSVWLLAACGSAVQSLMPSHSKGRPCRAGEFEGPTLYQQIARWRFRENTFIDARYIVPLQLFLPYPPQCFVFLVSVFLIVTEEISIATSLVWEGRKPCWRSLWTWLGMRCIVTTFVNCVLKTTVQLRVLSGIWSVKYGGAKWESQQARITAVLVGEDFWRSVVQLPAQSRTLANHALTWEYD